MAATAPLVLGRQELPGAEPIPNLPTGQDLYAAETRAAGAVADASDFSARAVGQAARQSGQAEAQFAQSLASSANSVATAIADAQRKTDLTERKTKLYTGLASIADDHSNDPDWKTAPQRASSEIDKLYAATMDGLSPSDQAELQQDLVRTRISVQKSITQTTVSKTQDAALAANDAATPTMLSRAAQSGSLDERNAVYTDYDKNIDGLVSTGMMTAENAVTKKQAFRKQVDSADVANGIATKPEATLKALDDPAMFPTLSPVEREGARERALAQKDQLSGYRTKDQAAANPVAAAATWNQRIPRELTGQIFDKVIAQESTGNPSAVGPQTVYGNAYGLGQLMPDTAREMARKLGDTETATLSEGQLKARLLSDPALNRRLGTAYLQQNLDAFDGHLAPALAAYHAGTNSPAVRRAYTAATEKFGPEFTAEQFASQLPDSLNDGGTTTSDYVRQIYGRLGADPTRGGVSTLQAYRNADIVNNQIAAQRAQLGRDLDQQIQLGGADRDAFIKQLEDGSPPAMQQYAALKAPIIQRAAMGDAAATVQLRRMSEAEANLPLIQTANQLPPERLESAVAQLQEQARGGQLDAPALRRLDVFRKVAAANAQLRVNDPVSLAERGGAPVTAIAPPQSPTDPAFASALAQRAVVAQGAAAQFGGPLKMLKPQEEIALKAHFGDAQPDEKAALIGTALSAVPNEGAFKSLLAQTVGDDRLAATAGLLGRSDPTLTRDILRGQALLDQPGVKPKIADVRGALQDKLPGGVYPAEVQGDMIEAAIAVYAAEKGRSGALFDPSDRDGLERAVERVAGRMVKINGQPVPVPPEGERTLRGGWQDLTQKTLDAAGGAVAPDGTLFDPRFLSRNAHLRTIAPRGGTYQVYLPGPGGQDAPVMTKAGKPLTVDLGMLGRGRPTIDVMDSLFNAMPQP